MRHLGAVCVCVHRMCMVRYLGGHDPHEPVVPAAGHQVGDMDQSLGWMRNDKLIYRNRCFCLKAGKREVAKTLI